MKRFKSTQINFWSWFIALTFLLVISHLSVVMAQPSRDIDTDGCTSVIVGRLASVDGATMTSHSCDSGTDRTWINVVPHQKHSPGSMAKIYSRSKRTYGPEDPGTVIGEIPQASETYAYINTAYACMNEYQLAIGETTCGGKRELRSNEGIIDCPELYRLVLERAKTARGAIKVADELTKEYGYIDTGECFTFADPKETWHFEILGPGKGKKGAVWAAVRIPDDHVGVSANAHRIQEIDLSKPDYYLASDNVFSLAEELGLWDPDGQEPFVFCHVYANRRGNLREWRALSLVAPSLKLDPKAIDYPLSVKAERKLSVKDVLAIFRDNYQGTEFDVLKDVDSPFASYFLDSDMRQLLNIGRQRAICCERATYLTVTQSRDWLCDPVGGVVWLGYDNPITTPHTPFYCGITRMPDSYMVDGRRGYQDHCAWWAYRRVSKFALFRWQDMTKDINKTWQEIEDSAFARQKEFEAKAVQFYNQNPQKCTEFLTQYSVDTAHQAVEAYKKLYEELVFKYYSR
ncbi:MAG: hypothetical protein AMJ79_01160 [Phycisphaerae bacterium SM23_30]|nr:MAG: hypothetical protein AMJ79_01160 [Phycisphaerae bacterium SM23_30]